MKRCERCGKPPAGEYELWAMDTSGNLVTGSTIPEMETMTLEEYRA